MHGTLGRFGGADPLRLALELAQSLADERGDLMAGIHVSAALHAVDPSRTRLVVGEDGSLVHSVSMPAPVCGECGRHGV